MIYKLLYLTWIFCQCQILSEFISAYKTVDPARSCCILSQINTWQILIFANMSVKKLMEAFIKFNKKTIRII